MGGFAADNNTKGASVGPIEQERASSEVEPGEISAGESAVDYNRGAVDYNRATKHRRRPGRGGGRSGW
jgi:hypothetical protein